MTIYVDNAFIPAKVPNGRMTHGAEWCHLFADTPEELHEFAAKLGLKPSYFQPGTRPDDPHWHYDVTQGIRAKAVALGAREVEYRDAPSIMRERDCMLTEGRRPRVHGTHPDDFKQADNAAGLSFKAGEHLKAARLIAEARVKYPNQPDLWAKRADAIHAAMRAANQPMQETDRPLAEVVTERLESAGVKAEDPEISHLAAWNDMQHSRALSVAEPPSIPAPELNLDEREATP